MIIVPSNVSGQQKVELVDYAFNSGAIDREAGDMIVLWSHSTISDPRYTTILPLQGGGNGLQLTVAYGFVSSSSESIPGFNAAASFRNATKIGGNSGVTWKQLANSRGYIDGFNLIDLSGNSAVVGWGNTSNNFNYFYPSYPDAPYTLVAPFRQTSMFQLLDTTQNPPTTDLSVPFGIWNGVMNFNVAAVEVSSA